MSGAPGGDERPDARRRAPGRFQKNSFFHNHVNLFMEKYKVYICRPLCSGHLVTHAFLRS